MKVILSADIKELGKKGEVKEVSEGHARNYLIPNKLALVANASNMSIVKSDQERLEKRKKQEVDKANKLIQKLHKTSVNIVAKMGENGKLFGSVTKEDIATALERDAGIKIDKHDVLLDEPIKNTGAFAVSVRMKLEGFPDEQAKTGEVKIWVIGEK